MSESKQPATFKPFKRPDRPDPGLAFRQVVYAAIALDPKRTIQQIASEVGLSHSALIDLMESRVDPRATTRIAIQTWASGITGALEAAFLAKELVAATEKVADVRPFTASSSQNGD